MEFTAQQLADYLKGSVVGDPNVKVSGFSKIEEGKPGTITFLANPKYEHFIYTTQASIVLVNNDFSPSSDVKATLIKAPNAYSALAALLNLVEQTKARKRGVDALACVAANALIDDSDGEVYIGAFAYVGENARIGRGVKIYPHVYIGDNARIGDNTVLYPHATVYDECSIGENCIIHAGAVIGSDGFGFAPENGEYRKIAQLGNVVIEDNVEIGANTTVDRAVMGATIIRKGVKLDNLIQVAHNVEIGENTVIAAQTGIAGSTKIGANCMFGGQTGIAGHLNIGENVQLGAQSGTISNIEANSKLMGTPVMPLTTYMRASIIIEKLPELYRTINQLQKKIEEIQKTHG